HLIVDAPNHRTHFQRDRTGDDDQIALSWAGTKDAGAKAVDVESSGASRNHLDGTTREAEGHGPKRRLACPVDYRCRDVDGFCAHGSSNRVHDRIDGS